MVLKDLFDSDPRSKVDLRREIIELNEQIKILKADLILRTAKVNSLIAGLNDIKLSLADGMGLPLEVGELDASSNLTDGLNLIDEVRNLIVADRGRQTSEIEELEKENLNLRDELKSEKTARQMLEASQSSRERNLETVRAQIAELTANLNEANEKLNPIKKQEFNEQQFRNEIASIKIHNERLKKDNAKLSSDLQEKMIALQAAQASAISPHRLQELKRQIVDGNSKNHTLRAQCDALKASYSYLEIDNQGYRSKLERVLRRVDKLEDALAKAKIPRVTRKPIEKNSFSNEVILGWLLSEDAIELAGFANREVGVSGDGPWNEGSLQEIFEKYSCDIYGLTEPSFEYIVVGRESWSKKDLLEQISLREKMPLRIYSQEMFIATILTGRDPFDTGDESLLAAFAEDHPALQFLRSLEYAWPTVTDTESDEIIEVSGENLGVKESPLHMLGYQVGTTSDLCEDERRALLAVCYEARDLEFSKDSTGEYIAAWGPPKSRQRLYRIAMHLKSLADGMVGRDPRKPQARADWVSDLAWLKKKYFGCLKETFYWPEINNDN